MCAVPQLSDLDLTDIDTVAVDLETYDPNLKTKGSGAVRKDGFVTGIAIATKKQTLYFPIAHAMTDNLNVNDTWEYLNEKLFKNKDIRKVFHNAMYDVCWIRSTTGKMLEGPLLDTMIAASVIDETRMKYSLDSISKDYLNESKYKYDLAEKSLSECGIKDPMSNMHKLPYSLVKEYAEQDVYLTLKLWNLFEKKLDEVLYTKENQDGSKEFKSCRKIFELETKLFPCLVDMKFKGVKIDIQKAKNLGKLLEKRRDNLVNIIKKHTGVEIEIWAASSIKKLLDHQQIIDYKKTKAGLPQLPKDYLKTHVNRFLRMIVKARECDKAKNTFVEGILGFVYQGRIHADINQIRSDQGGTVTGRFSMSNPNLQQIPARGIIGKKMRELFIPEDNCVWGSFDYSQQEPRIVVHYALKLGLPGTDTLKNEFNKDDADFHQIVADMAQISRTMAKTINLGLFYGMGKIKLQHELNLTRDKANTLFSAYHAKVPFVKRLSQDLIEFAEEHKLLFTLEDRFCRFNKWETRNREWNNKINKYEPVPILTRQDAETAFKAELLEKFKDNVADNYMQDFDRYYKPAFTYKALNRLIQGSAADMTKKAMVNLYEKGILPQIQIHDELCLSIKNDSDALVVKQIMEQAIPLEVKNKVNYKKGKNWGTIK
jgi:DNA polymerase I-like protein with 3'-5' exonuclease and polymerase domains|tara:strand:- start:42 stop:2006 length:1965 start_codon:yes stop_codon:yes gene_type:complete